MAGFPRFEFTGHVFAPRHAQFGDDATILCREPVLKLVESFDGRENGGWNFNGFRFHSGSLSRFAGNGKCFSLHVFLTATVWPSASAAERGVTSKGEPGQHAPRWPSAKTAHPTGARLGRVQGRHALVLRVPRVATIGQGILRAARP